VEPPVMSLISFNRHCPGVPPGAGSVLLKAFIRKIWCPQSIFRCRVSGRAGKRAGTRDAATAVCNVPARNSGTYFERARPDLLIQWTHSTHRDRHFDGALAHDGDAWRIESLMASVLLWVRSHTPAAKLFVAIALAAILFIPERATAQSPSEEQPELPQSLRDIFDLPWCKAWNLNCGIRCKKIEGKIVCEQTRQNCEESFKVSECVEYNVPEDCAVWFDGCNTCSRGRGAGGNGSCTLMRCPSYVPYYACRRRFPDVK
jgi:hypothetical protein